MPPLFVPTQSGAMGAALQIERPFHRLFIAVGFGWRQPVNPLTR